MSDTCGRPDCPGPARCHEPGCEALHPNACGADLPHWLCPWHEPKEEHAWLDEHDVEGYFTTTAWCWRCGTTVAWCEYGPYEYRVPGSMEIISRPSRDDEPPCVPVKQ